MPNTQWFQTLIQFFPSLKRVQQFQIQIKIINSFIFSQFPNQFQYISNTYKFPHLILDFIFFNLHLNNSFKPANQFSFTSLAAFQIILIKWCFHWQNIFNFFKFFLVITSVMSFQCCSVFIPTQTNKYFNWWLVDFTIYI
jgi:hypothetical protein